MYIGWGRSPQPPVPNTTGIVLRPNIVPTVEMALTQNPGTKHILLIAGVTEFDRALTNLLAPGAVKYLQETHKTVDVQLLPAGTIADNTRFLATLPQDTVSIFSTYFGDSSGEGFVSGRVLNQFSAISNRPIYGGVDVYLGRGIVGGSIMNLEASGAVFADSALRVIHGEDPATIPEVSNPPARNIFDWRQLKRWGIPMESIPAGSIVLNREFTFWELYKWRVIALLFLIVLEALLIVQLFLLVIRQKRNVKQLSYRRQMEALISEAATAFIDLPSELINREIESSLQRLLEFFDLDRVSLFEVSADTSQFMLLCTRGSPSAGRPLADIEMDPSAWNPSHFRRGSPILAARLDDLPDEYMKLKEALLARGVRSFAALPLQRDERVFGALGFSVVRSEREWDPDVVRALQTIADIFGSALGRKIAEDAERESRERLAGIVESAMDAIIAVDSEQRIMVFNAAAERMFGCAADDALGQLLERFIPDRFRARHKEHIHLYSQFPEGNHSMPMRGALWALRSNGEEFPMEASISQVTTNGSKLFTVIIRDITEREESQRKLRYSNDLNLSILQSLRIHLAVLDGEGKIVAATTRSPEFVTPCGLNALEFQIGANYLEMCRAAAKAGHLNAASVSEGIQAVYSGSQQHFELEYADRSGLDQRWFLMSVTPLKTSSGGVVISHEDITDRKRHVQAIQELSGRLINAQEHERSRIARELHDGINQQVAILAIELQQLAEKDSTGRQKVQELWEKTHLLSIEIQHLAHQLHSAKLEHLGITAALRGLCDEFSEQYGIESTFQFHQVPPKLDSDTSLALFRVAQESLRNVAKHSRAKTVRMELFGAEAQITLCVSDDGVGFCSDKVADSAGLGLISMSERIRLVGGTLSVRSVPSLGTRIEATIPIPRGLGEGNRRSESNVKAARN